MMIYIFDEFAILYMVNWYSDNWILLYDWPLNMFDEKAFSTSMNTCIVFEALCSK